MAPVEGKTALVLFYAERPTLWTCAYDTLKTLEGWLAREITISISHLP